MEFQPVRVEIVFHGGGAGFPLEFIYYVDWNSKANKDYFSYEYMGWIQLEGSIKL